MAVHSHANTSAQELTLVDTNNKESPDSASSRKHADSGPFLTTGIKAPPRRGRPRGHDLTTVGLPAKKAKKESAKKPCSFSKMHISKKEEGTCRSVIHRSQFSVP